MRTKNKISIKQKEKNICIRIRKIREGKKIEKEKCEREGNKEEDKGAKAARTEAEMMQMQMLMMTIVDRSGIMHINTEEYNLSTGALV